MISTGPAQPQNGLPVTSAVLLRLTLASREPSSVPTSGIVW